MKMKTNKGFTLIELLIVIAIIGILATALLPAVLNAPMRGRDAARSGNLNSIVAAIESYSADYGKYPQNSGCIGTGDVFQDDGGINVVDNYFIGGTAPEDPSGERTGLTDDPGTCVAAGQYYYKYIGTTGTAEYIMATIMEIEASNNYTGDPSTIPADGNPIVTGESGTCFVAIH